MLKFINGRPAMLLSHTGADQNGGGGNAAFLASLPEPLRAHDAFKDIADVGTLAQRFADTRKPFADQLPEKIRGEAFFKDIKSLDALADIAYNQAKLVGADKNTLMHMPKGADDKDGWNNIYTKLGRPEAADKYDIPKRGEKQEYSEQETAFQKAILPVLFEAGLSQSQVAKIVPQWNQMMDANSKAVADHQAANMTKAADALKADLGAAYDEKVGLGQQALAHYGSPELIAELEATGADGKKIPLGNNPHLMRLFIKLGEGLKEDGLLGKGGSDNANGALSPAEAQQQINAKMGDKEFMAAYTGKNHPGHKDAVAEMQRLYSFKSPA